jgi:hypothetical protein
MGKASINGAVATRVLVPHGRAVVDHERADLAAPVLRGTTDHFTVSYDPQLGEAGITLADAILAACEADYSTLRGYFGGITPPGLPFNILITSGQTGASHSTCADVNLSVGGRSAAGVSAGFILSLVIAEEDEVFEAASGLGWDCGASHGEGLSRVLANDMYRGVEPPNFMSAPVWLDQTSPDFGYRPDFITRTLPFEEGGDRDYWAIGCSVLFLNWLRFQLGYSWNQIIAAGAATLDSVYQKLTVRTDALQRFQSHIEANYPSGTPSGLATDQPFPLPGLPA